MEILKYNDLDLAGVKPQFDRIAEMLATGNFRAADAKKLAPTPYYRAKLNDADRLLFSIGVCNGEKYILLLEVIRNHAYEKSRFLAGVPVDEAKLEPLSQTDDASGGRATPLAYVNPRHRHFHFLNKILSFDDAQHDAYCLPPPLIVIGSAGSGKTALCLEKIKSLSGDLLYTTLSQFLADNSRDLYYSMGYENYDQNMDFLSFREFLETLRVPPGRPVAFRNFAAWHARRAYSSRIKNSHMLYEEFNGVLTGMPTDKPHLGREEYMALGVRRSIFPPEQRGEVYDIFLKYLEWLAESGFYDSNIVSFEYQAICRPRYDFVVVDEVQDMTNVQTCLVLSALRQKDNFILCGDSNQIVHPNFFSWANVKTMFYNRRDEGRAEITRILSANYRNSPQVTDVANKLLLVKRSRFGDVDKESSYLVEPLASAKGAVELLKADEKSAAGLDAETRRSVKFAVIVMRAEDKAEAARVFRTPLLFSVQEAKGLEYESVILYNFVSGAAREFMEITDGVEPANMNPDAPYSRARDKTDKSLEAFKFYVNSLYVAITRAILNVYVLERDTSHRLWRLLGLAAAGAAPAVAARNSTAEEWKEEAVRLERQGKTEQAEAIRKNVLAQQAPPWTALTPDGLEELKKEAFDPQVFNKQAKQSLFEYAVVYNIPSLMAELVKFKFTKAANPAGETVHIRHKHFQDYQEKSLWELNRKIGLYGPDFRNRFNQTPLMAAAQLGLEELARSLLDAGARAEATDNLGRTPLQIALREAFLSQSYAGRHIGPIYGLLAPSSVKLKIEDRLVKLDKRLMEFFMLQSMIALFQEVARIKTQYSIPAFQTGDFVHALRFFPEHVIPERRKKRAYLTSILAKNEVHRNDPYNRKLFARVRHGYYIINPSLEIEVNGEWIAIYDLMGVALLEQENNPRLAPLLNFVRTWRRASAPADAASEAEAAASEAAPLPNASVEPL